MTLKHHQTTSAAASTDGPPPAAETECTIDLERPWDDVDPDVTWDQLPEALKFSDQTETED